MEQSLKMTARELICRRSRSSVGVLSLTAALLWTAATTAAAADPVLDLAFTSSAGSAPLEVSVLDDGDLAQLHARGLVPALATTVGATKKIILWDEAYHRVPLENGPNLTPNTPNANNSVTRRGGW